MPIAVEDVPHWLVEAGVGHAVEWTEGPDGVTRTACGGLFAGVPLAPPGVPARVCRACRRRLLTARPAPLGADGTRPPYRPQEGRS